MITEVKIKSVIKPFMKSKKCTNLLLKVSVRQQNEKGDKSTKKEAGCDGSHKQPL